MPMARVRCADALVPFYHPKDIKYFVQATALMWLTSYPDYSQEFDKLTSGDWLGHRAT